MAEMQADGRDDAPAKGKSIASVVNLAGAAVSLALVVGVGVWGYKLITRDISGVPVVRAAEGPMRVQPEDPGGAPAENQGLAVNKVAAIGTAAKPADRLILAPRPIDLSSEDAVSRPQPVPSAEDGAADANAAVEALVGQLLADAQPLGTADGDQPVQQAALKQVTVETPKPLGTAATAAKPARVAGGLGQSLRPRPRPANARELASLKPVPAVAQALDVDPDSLPAGTRLAQLGAYESEQIARQEWAKLAGRFGAYLEDKQRVIQKAESGGRTFYRLRAHGFADISEARRFCSALLAEKAECIPVTTK